MNLIGMRARRQGRGRMRFPPRDKIDNTNWALECPRCDGAYLHQEAVTVYDRREDAPQTIETTVVRGDGTVVRTVPSERSSNPSDRRHGSAIRFSCEGCSAEPELTIEQHKGNTYLAWRNW